MGARLFYSTHVLNSGGWMMQFAVVMSLVLFISASLLLYQFVAGTLVGADEPRPSWPHKARRAN
jgi:hypothetical protein